MATREEQLRAKLEAAFKETDTDKSGSISHAELKNALKKAGFEPTDKDIQFIIKEADKDNSGNLNFDEFAAAMIALSIRVTIAMELRTAFMAVDTDGSGYITADEVKKLIKDSGHRADVTDAEIEELVKACDDNGDGKISFEEFVNNMVQ